MTRLYSNKVTKREVKQMFRERERGSSYREIAIRHHLSLTTVYYWLKLKGLEHDNKK